jgi:hypothetical protein
VLFADVKGSMDLAEQVDPEEWHKRSHNLAEGTVQVGRPRPGNFGPMPIYRITPCWFRCNSHHWA